MFPRTALVTGGASGIGAAIVALLRGEGAEVEVLDLNNGFDVSDAEAWEAVGAVELACLNAGVVTGEGDLARVSGERYRRSARAHIGGGMVGTRPRASGVSWGAGIC